MAFIRRYLVEILGALTGAALAVGGFGLLGVAIAYGVR